jgi:hypothetical protein
MLACSFCAVHARLGTRQYFIFLVYLVDIYIYIYIYRQELIRNANKGRGCRVNFKYNNNIVFGLRL